MVIFWSNTNLQQACYASDKLQKNRQIKNFGEKGPPMTIILVHFAIINPLKRPIKALKRCTVSISKPPSRRMGESGGKRQLYLGEMSQNVAPVMIENPSPLKNQ